MLAVVAGPTFAAHAGDVVSISDVEAQQLIAGGYAEAVAEETATERLPDETATETAAETATDGDSETR